MPSQDEADADEAEEEFDRVWQAVGTNLRPGQARLVVALDEAPPSLERIFRFLARRSYLDVRLITVQKHAPNGGDVFVPRTVINPVTERDASPSLQLPLDARLLAIIDDYDSSASPDLRTTGTHRAVRCITPRDGAPVVKAMEDLIEATKDVVTDRIKEIRRGGGIPAAE